MAIARKGWRRIVVDGATYYWRAFDHCRDRWCGVQLAIVGETAFTRGIRAQQLVAYLDHDWLEVPHPSARLFHHEPAAITPAIVRLAIERGRTANPPFTGEPGRPDVMLDKAICA